MTEPKIEVDLIDDAFRLLCHKYVQRSDQRQKAMGLQYTEAETHDLATFVAAFAAQRVEAWMNTIKIDPNPEETIRAAVAEAEAAWIAKTKELHLYYANAIRALKEQSDE